MCPNGGRGTKKPRTPKEFASTRTEDAKRMMAVAGLLDQALRGPHERPHSSGFSFSTKPIRGTLSRKRKSPEKRGTFGGSQVCVFMICLLARLRSEATRSSCGRAGERKATAAGYYLHSCNIPEVQCDACILHRLVLGQRSPTRRCRGDHYNIFCAVSSPFHFSCVFVCALQQVISSIFLSELGRRRHGVAGHDIECRSSLGGYEKLDGRKICVASEPGAERIRPPRQEGESSRISGIQPSSCDLS